MNDIKLNFINNSNDTHNSSIIIFMQNVPYEPDGLPLVWKFFPLKGPEQEVVRRGSVTYTAEQSISVTRSPQPNDRAPYGNLEIFRTVRSGDQTVFSIDSYGALHLDLLPGKNPDGTASCINQSEDMVPVSLCKSGSPLATAAVGPHTTVVFSIPLQLYVACMSIVSEGGGERRVMTSAPVQELDLRNCTEITVTLQDSAEGGKSWQVERM